VSKGKLLAICCVWLVILTIAAAAWKMYTGWSSDKPFTSRYDYEVTFALDSFSGYAVLRSEAFREELAKKHIKLKLEDDGADYAKRLRALQKGDVQLAAFTVDALIKASAELGKLPGAIVAVIDETRGADAMVAYKGAFPNVTALNDSRTQFVLTPDSPSETLARVVMAHFDLDALGATPFVEARDAEDVYRRYRISPPDTHQVFVLWEPYVSKALENPNMQVVVDSSRFRGYIVDVIVVNKDYLLKNEDVVASFVDAYFSVLHANRDRMIQLVLEDAKTTGQPLTTAQAKNLVRGIRWKNTPENYAHFGLHADKTVQHVEDIIGNITGVLVGTGGIDADPTDGNPRLLYYKEVLARLQAMPNRRQQEEIRVDKVELRKLAPAEWERLEPLGTWEVPPLAFARGSARLTRQSEMALDELAEKLETWPEYYVLVRGNALRDSDPEVYQANEALALQRAKAAEQYLIAKGVSQGRVRAIGVEPSGSTSVSFVAGLPP
jgi:hypothetical protein